jgi:hypothetical protein
MSSHPTGLERQLRALGAELDWPAAPDVTAAALERIRADRAPRRANAWRPAVAVALALVVAAAALLAASPGTRADLLRRLGIGAVRVEYVRELPPTSTRLDLGTAVRLEEAALTGLPIPRVPGLGAALSVHVSREAAGGIVTLRFRDDGGRPLLLSVFRGDAIAFAKKLVRGDTPARFVDVRGASGYWIGAPHAVMFIDAKGVGREQRPRLSASTLAWVRGPITYRLETSLSEREALRLARSIR